MNNARSIRSRLPGLLLALVFSLGSLTFAQEAPTMSLPVSRVVLFTNGVGYFEHAGTVHGTQEVLLRIESHDMDDLLQSLVLLDLDGGSVQAVRYPSQDPLARTLASYSLDLSGNPSLADLLRQARGEGVRITAGTSLAGTIVSVETVQAPESAPLHYLNLSTDDGFRRINLAEVRDIRFDRAELRAEMDAALAAISRHRETDLNEVRLRFSGDGERRVVVGYVREMPVWKTSYRVVLGDDGSAELQGWAIFDNPTSLDLRDIEVSFVAGQPISFITSLYEPVYVQRPRIQPAVSESHVPPEYESMPVPSAPAPMMEMQARMADTLEDMGVSAAATGSQQGVNFEYRVSEPVSIPRYESAMIPIVQQTIPGQRLSVFDPAVRDDNPMRGVLLENDTGLHLAAGTVTVFDAGGFAGNARMADVLPGASALLTYATDLAVRVSREATTEPDTVTDVRLDSGLLVSTILHRHVTTWRLASDTDSTRLLLVEHAARPGFEIVEPEPAPVRTRDGYRLGVLLEAEAAGDVQERLSLPVQLTCDAGSECTLRVVEERVAASSVSLSTIESDRIALYLANYEFPADQRATLQEVHDLQVSLSGLRAELSRLNERRDDIFVEQERIRANMAGLEQSGSLYQRYVTELTEQEDELAEITERVAELRQEISDVEAERDALFRRLLNG